MAGQVSAAETPNWISALSGIQESPLWDRVEVAVSTACEAGKLALELSYNERELLHSMKNAHDFLSVADEAVEQLILERIGQRAPSHDTIVAEELGGSPGESVWVVDPIDGTANYVNRLPDWCISIAYVQDAVEEIAVVFAPVLKQLFVAVRGYGASMNGTRIRVATDVPIDRAIIEIDTDATLPAEQFRSLVLGVLDAGLDFRRHGAAALALARVAAGYRHAFVDLHSKPWDALAGVLLVREAGGWTNSFVDDVWRNSGNPVVGCSPVLLEVLSSIPSLAHVFE